MSTVDKIMALATEMKDRASEVDYKNGDIAEYRAARDALRTAIVEALDMGEPVAWRGRFRTEWAVNSWSYSDGAEKPPWSPWDGERGHDIEPLYTTPSAAIARAERAEAALRNIKIEYEREGSKMHHLQRVVAIQCREGLALSPAPTVKGEGEGWEAPAWAWGIPSTTVKGA